MKIKFNAWQLLLLILAISSMPLMAQGDSNSKEHVVILSMDGFRWDYTLDAHTPTLDSLRRVGSYSQMIPVFPSNTFPSHYSMATGLYPNHHGVTNNHFYNKEIGRIMKVSSYEDCTSEGFWGGEPIWNTVELQGGTSHIYMWPGSEYPINGRQATIWTKYDHNMDYFVRADKVVASMSLNEEELPNLVMWYMPDPDAIGHKKGPNSKECIERVEYIDSVLAYFFARMRETPHFDSINFIVTSDHGMTALDPSRYINLYGALDADKVKLHIGGSPFALEVDEDYVDEAVAKLNAIGHMNAYRADSMPEEFHYGTHPTRCTNIVVLPEMGWRLDYSRKDDPIAGGAHGYNPFESDMQMVFFGVGGKFKQGYSQASFQNQNIYLLLCHLLGLEPAPNDCDMGAIEGMLR